MNMSEGLFDWEPWRVASRNPLSFPPRGADTLARITDDDYKDGGEGNSTRQLGMNVNSLDKGNHSSPRREDSPTLLSIMVMDI